MLRIALKSVNLDSIVPTLPMAVITPRTFLQTLINYAHLNGQKAKKISMPK